MTSPKHSKEFVETSGGSDKTFRGFENASHELHFEVLEVKEAVVKAYVEWITSHSVKK